ncbi:Uncharacterised protein [Klebsiella pneumoniae]|nr:Uncharacterised protein [Klebsiella pneumoniae]
MFTGIRPSLISEPGRRKAVTSIGLMALMPFWMKVLSPQFTTCLPRRTLPGRSPMA